MHRFFLIRFLFIRITRLEIACFVNRFLIWLHIVQTRAHSHERHARFLWDSVSKKKSRTPQRRMSLKFNLLLRYPDSKGRIENEPYSDFYQIRDLEREHGSWHILNFSIFVILIKRILIEKKQYIELWCNTF